jgi:hypothetical protein
MMEKDVLREAVLEALRRQPRTQFRGIEVQVQGHTPGYHSQDGLLLREIIWELLIEGILAPGMDSSNIEFPFVHVTEYGKRCLDAGAIVPQNPGRFLTHLQAQVGQPLDDTVRTYIEESLQTYLKGHYLASTVMLGVASERCVDLLVEAYANSISDTNHKTAFQRAVKQAGRSVKRRFDVLRKELLALSLPSELADALDIQLSGIFTLIRYSRNDAGHPTGRSIDRDVAYGNLLLYPQYCKRVYGLIQHLSSP